MGEQALAYSVKAKWIDHATIQVDQMEFDNSDAAGVGIRLSDESQALIDFVSGTDSNGTNPVGNQKLREVINAQSTGLYKDGDLLDSEEYTKGVCGGKNSKIRVTDYGANRGEVVANSLRWDFSSPGFSDSGCHAYAQAQGLPVAGITIDDPDGVRDVWFIASDDLTTLTKVDGSDGVFKPKDPSLPGSNPNTFFAATGRNCGGSTTSVVIDGDKGQDIMTGTYFHCLSNRAPIKIKIMKSSAHDKVTGVPPGTTGSGAADQTRVTCETSGNPLTWALCPIFNGIGAVTEWLLHSFIEPFLYTAPVSTTPGDGGYEAWSSFRVYADILLIIVLLVVVFGQSIGGGLIEAYTAKKIIPRLVAAIILINLSLYIVNFSIDVTNVIGKGIGQLLFAPFSGAGLGSFNLSIDQIISGAGLGVLGTILASGSIVGFVSGALTEGAAGSALVYAGLAFLLPVLLTVLAVIATLILRKGLLLFLTIISPIAFLAYCLPNTEKYFKKWWEYLSRALVMYPIVIVIFVMANIMSATMLKANDIRGTGQTGTGGEVLSGGLAAIAAFILQFLPLILIPFAFKLAGGAIAGIYGAIKGGRDKAHEMSQSRTEHAKNKYQTKALQGRQNVYSGLNAKAKGGVLRRKGFSFLASRAGGYNIEAEMSAMRAETDKVFSDQIASGVDDEVRALNVNRTLFQTAKRGKGALAAAGFKEGEDYKLDENGRVSQLANMSGKMYDIGTVQQAYNRWGGNQAALQKSISYEMGKAATQPEIDSLVNSYSGLAKSWGMADGQAYGVWTGAAYANQNQNLEFKYHTWDKNRGELSVNGLGLMREIDEKRGNYQMAQQHAETWVTMQSEVRRARRIANGQASTEELVLVGGKKSDGTIDHAKATQNAQETLQRASRIARTSAMSLRGGGGNAVRNPEGEVVNIERTGGVAEGGFTVSGSGAPARVQEEIENFVKMMHPEVTAPSPSTYPEGAPPAPGTIRYPLRGEAGPQRSTDRRDRNQP